MAAAVKRAAGVKGDLDAFGAMHFLAGLLTILRDSGRSGLVLVLDEAETLQRMRADTREKGLNALRQLLDELDAGRYPGLYLVVTGTSAFFEGPQGVQRLPPLAQRLHTDFATDARFDNPRAVQVRLPGFDLDALAAVGRRVRDIFAEQAQDPARISATVDDGYVADLARGVAGRLGGRAGVAPRLYLRKLVAEVLDRVDQFADFDPRRHYAPTVDEREMTAAERAAAGAADVDDVVFELVTAAFDALHPALRYHIVSTLGWSDLRPTQAEAVGPLMAGEDVLLLAPTAGGKTEAAAFPLLSLIASQGWRGLSALYVCPLKALLNNLAQRLEHYAGFLGMRVGLWHGDVGEPARRRMLRDPPEILLTTPELVEAMMISARIEHEKFLQGVHVVIVDELHAFAGDDRGWHLLRNSTTARSPVRLMTRPLCTEMVGSIRSLRSARNRANVRSSSAPVSRLKSTVIRHPILTPRLGVVSS